MPFTVVSFHAHPDDEALFTAGTLARAAAEGHRVVLVTATAGEAGLADATYSPGPELAARRRHELAASAAAIGCQRTELFGFADSGSDGQAGGDAAFARMDLDQAAAPLTALLIQERADALTVYDPVGGYGHPDHVAVHRVGVRAAALAGTPVVLEATVDRQALQWAARIIHHLPGVPTDFHPDRFTDAFVPRPLLTHTVDVRGYADQKRAAMAAHHSQATSEMGRRTLDIFRQLPMPLFRRVFGREWFVERGRPPGKPIDDIFQTLRRPH
jgi:LmbE family N-acetylglucosaminyl deacetylase